MVELIRWAKNRRYTFSSELKISVGVIRTATVFHSWVRIRLVAYWLDPLATPL